jgi:hypothetical protein
VNTRRTQDRKPKNRSGTDPSETQEQLTQESRPGAGNLNQVPNAELGRTLMQILKARKLAAGISISVSNEVITVFGEVQSEEEKTALLEILDKAREARRVDSSQLKVNPQ